MGGRAQKNKPHKTRFSSKSSLNLHKTIKDKHQITKNERNAGKRGKAARRQQKNMIAADAQKKRESNSPNSPPRVIVLFGLSAGVDLNSLESDLVAQLSPTKCSNEVFPTVVSSDYRLRATVLKAPHGDLSSCMEMAKVADLIAFVASANHDSQEYIDPFGEQCLSVFKSLGMPNIVALIRDLPSDLKRRHEAKKLCTSSVASELPESCKFFAADKKDELHKFLCHYKEQTLSSPIWRNQRAYVATQKVDIQHIEARRRWRKETTAKLKNILFPYMNSQEANLQDAWKKDQHRRTEDLDRTTKVFALKASSSVVSLFSFSGDVVTGRGVGTIIETDRNVNTVISSLNVIKKPINEEYPETYHRNELVDDVKVVVFSSDDNVYLGEVICWDFHYNVFVLKFRSRRLLKPAELAWISEDDYQPSVLRPHSRTVKSGEPVVIVGRYFNDLDSASGLFSLCPALKFHDCLELVTSTARISKSGEGAPVINLRGAVVGIAYYASDETSPILPIEVANKWWSHYKQHKESRHLSYGFVGCQLFSASLTFLEKFRADFPNIDNGVLLGCVFEDSSADSAGLLEDDVIVKYDGKPVQAFFELWSLMWDKVGDAVELEVARVGSNKIQVIRMEVGETNELYRWPLF